MSPRSEVAAEADTAMARRVAADRPAAECSAKLPAPACKDDRPRVTCHGSTSALWHGPSGVAFADSCDCGSQCIERCAVHCETPLPILSPAITQHDFTIPLQCIELHPNTV